SHVVFENNRTVFDDQYRQRLFQLTGPKHVRHVPTAVGKPAEAKPRLVQLHFANDQLAVVELLLVVINQRGGDIGELGSLVAFSPAQVQLVERYFAEQSQISG